MERLSASLSSSPAKRSLDIEKQIEAALEMHENLVSQSKFEEAGNLLDEIAKLKTQQKAAVVRELKNWHAEEQDDVQTQYWRELRDLNLAWGNAIEEEEKAICTAIEELQGQHKRKLEKHLQSLDKQLSAEMKPSSYLLNLKKQLEASIKAKKYHEAQAFQNDVQAVTAQETEVFFAQRRDKIKAAAEALKQKQILEMQSLKMKLHRNLQELKLRMKAETDKMLQRNKNYTKALLNAQSIQRNILTGKHTTLAGKHNPSKSFSMSRSPDYWES